MFQCVDVMMTALFFEVLWYFLHPSFLPAWLFLDTGLSRYGGGVSGVCPDQSR